MIVWFQFNCTDAVALEREVSYLFDNRLWDSVRTYFSIQVQQGIQVSCSAVKQLIWKLSICACDCPLELQQPASDKNGRRDR